MPAAPRVALFASCMTDFALPGPAYAAVRVLEAMGYEVDVPAGQSCCGQPALNSGYADEAARVMRSWAKSFSGAEAIVSLAGSCAAMIHHHAARLLDDEEVAGLPPMWEFSQFVCEFGGDLDLACAGTVTYHDSCHMTRMLGERRTPRELISRIRGLELVEMLDSDHCCGFGGTFSVKFPEVSTSMADQKLGTASAAAQVMVSSDPGCMTHLAARAERSSAPVRFLHLAELAALSLPGAPRTLDATTEVLR